MKIESCDFGKINIDEKEYTHDVILHQGKVILWWQQQSHWVDVSDLGEIIEKKPEIIILGTGHSGVMEVSKEAKEYLEKLGIEVIIEQTKKACDIFNKLSEKQGVVAALHLTC